VTSIAVAFVRWHNQRSVSLFRTEVRAVPLYILVHDETINARSLCRPHERNASRSSLRIYRKMWTRVRSRKVVLNRQFSVMMPLTYHSGLGKCIKRSRIGKVWIPDAAVDQKICFNRKESVLLRLTGLFPTVIDTCLCGTECISVHTLFAIRLVSDMHYRSTACENLFTAQEGFRECLGGSTFWLADTVQYRYAANTTGGWFSPAW